MPDLGRWHMAPPRRFACRQLPRRMTIHSDGRVALCDQDWLAQGLPAAQADTRTRRLLDIWRDLCAIAAAHRAGTWDQLPLCAGCAQWHRV